MSSVVICDACGFKKASEAIASIKMEIQNPDVKEGAHTIRLDVCSDHWDFIACALSVHQLGGLPPRLKEYLKVPIIEGS